MSTSSTSAPAGRPTTVRRSTCKGGHRYTRAAAVIEARRAESGRQRFRAYRCSTCLQSNGNSAWHVGPLSWWRRWFLGQGAS